jgi:hypothetical protein
MRALVRSSASLGIWEFFLLLGCARCILVNGCRRKIVLKRTAQLVNECLEARCALTTDVKQA